MQFLFSVLLLFSCMLGIQVWQPVQANESLPLYYTRANILIHRQHVPVTAGDDSAPSPVQNDQPLMFDVEVRDASAFYKQDGWFNLSEMTEGKGVLLIFGEPASAPIMQSTQYAPLDILMADERGTIYQIVPSLVLSSLEEDIMPEKPARAFLLLKGGTCEQYAINPGDDIEYSLFKKPPPVLNSATPVVVPPPTTDKKERLETPEQKMVEPSPPNANKLDTLQIRRKPVSQPGTKQEGGGP